MLIQKILCQSLAPPFNSKWYAATILRAKFTYFWQTSKRQDLQGLFHSASKTLTAGMPNKVSECVCVCACVRACVCAWVCAEMPKLKWDLHVQRYTPCEAVWYRWLRAESWKVTLGYFRLMRSFSFCNTYGHGYDYECSQHHAPCHTLLDMWQ